MRRVTLWVLSTIANRGVQPVALRGCNIRLYIIRGVFRKRDIVHVNKVQHARVVCHCQRDGYEHHADQGARHYN